MSRDSITLKTFKSGIITQAHQEDSPLEAFIWGKDIDPESTDGRVQGIKGVGSDLGYGDKARISALIENDGAYDLILHNSADNKVTAVVDFYNSLSARKEIDIDTSTSDSTTILINNKEAHIGVGNAGTTANDPIWAGYVQQGIFSFGLSWSISGCANNGAGLIRVSTTSEHSLSNGDLVYISGVSGTTEANGIWMVSNTYNWDAGGTNAYFDLVGSTFANAYTSGGTAAQHLVIANDYLSTPTAGGTDGDIGITSLTDTVGSGTDKYFLTTKGYMYAWSAVFDGYQEGNLRLFSDTTADIPAADSSYYTIVLTAYGATPTTTNHSGLGSFNKRITGINIYRAEGGRLEGIGGLGLFQLIKSIDLNDAAWSTSGDDKTYTFNDYGSTIGTTYEENTGISEYLGKQTSLAYVQYTLSAKGNGYAFYGNCWKSHIPDAERYIFRSKYYRFSMVDWSQDFLIMPRPITTMAFYEGRLYAFDLNNTYRINPDTLSIEDTFEGIGAMGQRSVCVTPYGMFIANTNGAYMFDGSNFTELSTAIKNSNYTATGQTPTSLSWDTFDFTIITDIIVTYSTEKQCVIFGNTVTISATVYFMAWVWNVPRNRWDFWDLYEADVSTGIITGKDGELYLSKSGTTKQLFTGSRKLFAFVTKEFDFDDPSQDKSINMIKWDGSLLTVKYDYNGANPIAGSTATSGAYLNQYKKTIQIYVAATDAASYLDSLDIVFRRKVGKR